MKRIISGILFTAVLVTCNPFTAKAAVGDITVGAMTWFSWWKPVWRNYSANGGVAQFDLPPGFITGPVISTQIDEATTISAVFLYYMYNTSDTLYFPASSYEYERDVHKIESDIIINRRFNNWLKYFFGVKYQGYFYSETETFRSGAVELPVENDVSFHNLGPGGGVGFTVHVWDNLYFLPNIGVIMLFGYEKTDEVHFSYCLGGNVTLSLAYVISDWNLTVALGGRFQHLHYLYHGNDNYSSIGNRYDQLYGVTLTLVARF